MHEDEDNHCCYDQGGQEGSGDARQTSKQGKRRRCDRADGNPNRDPDRKPDWNPDWKPTTAELFRKDQDETKVTPLSKSKETQ